MFGIGGFELVLILIFGFLVFGPDKLPEIAKGASKMIANLRNMQAQVSEVIKTEVYDPDSDEPFKNPLDALTKDGKEGDAKKTAAGAAGASAAKTGAAGAAKAKPTEKKETQPTAKSETPKTKPAAAKAVAKKPAAKAEPAEKKEGEE